MDSKDSGFEDVDFFREGFDTIESLRVERDHYKRLLENAGAKYGIPDAELYADD